MFDHIILKLLVVLFVLILSHSIGTSGISSYKQSLDFPIIHPGGSLSGAAPYPCDLVILDIILPIFIFRSY